MIHGNIAGIRDSYLQDLERLYEMEFERDTFLPDRLLGLLVKYTELLNREIMVYMTRGGAVIEIAIGSIASVGLPERHMRRNVERLSEIRCIHTHPGGSAHLSDVDEQALRLMRFDAMCAVGVNNGIATGISAAFLGDPEYGQLSVVTFGPVKPGRIPQGLWMQEIQLAERRVERAIAEMDVVDEAEKAILIGIEDERSLDELNSLASTAGAVVLGRVLQKRQKPDPSSYIGKGKAEELAMQCQALDIDLVLVDDEMSGAQQRNLEAILGVPVVDRTALILDIFAKRAESREGKLQVELAQMKYRLPRLSGMGVSMSRLGGGIGTRGPGESKLEVDRRHIRHRIDELSKELLELGRQRDMRRARRKKADQTVVALVGYTNAGKSTLLNALSGSDVLVEDKLFATLDPVIRKLDLPENRECLLVDTVGFIRKLPHQLVNAFKSTLEEALYADLLVIVSDFSASNYEEQREIVFSVLRELGAGDKPVLEALNKADAAIERDANVVEDRDAVLISATNGMGLDRLRAAISSRIAAMRHKITLQIPYAKGAALSLLHEHGVILSEAYTDEGTMVECLVDGQLLKQINRTLGIDTSLRPQ